MKKSILLSFLILIGLTNHTFATDWGNDITSNQTWTTEMSPINITNYFSIIGSGTVLTIQSNVEVIFNGYTITIETGANINAMAGTLQNGGIIALGTINATGANFDNVWIAVDGSFTASNCTFNYGGIGPNNYSATSPMNLNIQNCTFTSSFINIYALGNGTRTINGNTLNDPDGYGYIQITGNQGSTSITNNIFNSTATEYYPIYFDGELPNPTITGNTFPTGSRILLYYIGINSNRTIQNYQNLPYHFWQSSGTYYYHGSITVSNNSTLIIPSGIHLYYPYIYVESGSTLNATGVNFDGTLSETPMGKINPQIEKMIEQRTQNIKLPQEKPSARISANNASIEKASGTQSGGFVQLNGNSNLSVQNCTFTYGLNIYSDYATGTSPNLDIQNSTFNDSYIDINSNNAGTRTVNGNTFNNWAYIYLSGNQGTVSITNNIFNSSVTDYYPLYFDGELPNPTITGNTFPAGSKIYFINSITVNSNRTIQNYQNLSYYGGSLTLSNNANLTIPSGIKVYNTSFNVNTGSALTATGANFDNVWIAVDGSFTASNCTFNYGGIGSYGYTANAPMNLNVQNCTFTNYSLGIYALGNGTRTINGNTFNDPDGYGYGSIQITGNQGSTSITNNIINSSLAEYYPIYFDGELPNPTITGNTFPAGSKIFVYTITVNNNRTLQNYQNLPYYFYEYRGQYNYYHGSMTISNSSTLTIPSGLHLNYPYLYVEEGSTLNATGVNFDGTLSETPMGKINPQIEKMIEQRTQNIKLPQEKPSASISANNTSIGKASDSQSGGFIQLNANSNLSVQNCTFTYGLNVYSDNTAGANQNVSIQNSTFNNSIIDLNLTGSGTRTINGNTFNDSDSWNWEYIRLFGNQGTTSITNNIFNSTATEYYPIQFDQELPNPTITGNTFPTGSRIILQSITVNSNRTMQNYQNLPYYGGGSLALSSNSTLTIPSGIKVYNTSFNVNTGSALTATGANFDNVWIAVDGSFTASNCTFNYGGIGSYGYTANAPMNLNVQNCTFASSFINIYALGNGTRTISGNTVNDADGYGFIQMTGNQGSTSITNNIINSSLAEYYPIYFDGELPNPTITGNTFPAGSKIYVYTVTVNSNRTMQNYQNLPYYFYEYWGPYNYYHGSITVSSNSTLTIPSGMHLYYPNIYVESGSTLNATGVNFDGATSATSLNKLNPQIEKIIADKKLNTTAPKYSFSAEAVLTQDYGYIYNSGNLNIQNSIFVKIYTEFYEGSQGTINYSDFLIPQTNYAIYNYGTNIINAENNYWNGDLGPQNPSNPSGNGCLVSDYVDFEPYATALLNFISVPTSVEINEITINSFQTYYPQLNQFPEYINFEDQIEIKGRVLDQIGEPMPNSQVGIEDGLRLYSSAVDADNFGNFIYDTYIDQSNTSSSKNIMFFLPNRFEYSFLAFAINIPLVNNLLSQEFLQQVKEIINNQNSYSITELSVLDENQAPYWVSPNYISGLYKISSAVEVNENNYFHIIQQYNLQQTDPYINNPEIYTKAVQIQKQLSEELAKNYLENYKPGPLKTIAYIGAGAFCASTIFAPNPIGAAACGIVVNMAVEDVIKGTALTVMEATGVPEDVINDISLGASISLAIWDIGLGDVLLPSSSEFEYLLTQVGDIADVYDAGYLAYNDNTQPFENGSYSLTDGQFNFNFNYNGNTYGAILTVASKKTPVIFIPGIMGSPLYDDKVPLNQLTDLENIWVNEEKLVWPGDAFLDVLQLDENGESALNDNYNIQVAPIRGDINNNYETQFEHKPLSYYKGFFDELTSWSPTDNFYLLDYNNIEPTYGEDLFCFTYDWRKSSTYNSIKLNEFINKVKNWTGSNKVNIVAHSMGGLVTKNYIKDFGGQNIKKLIFVATPHLGSPKMLPIMLTGSLYNLVSVWANNDEMVKISRNMPSAYELFPSNNYTNPDISNGVTENGLDLYNNYFEFSSGYKANYSETQDYYKSVSLGNGRTLNNTLINSASEFHSSLENVNLDEVEEVYNIVGVGTKTIGTVKDRLLVNSHHPKIINYVNGDGNVPLKSAETINLSIKKADYYINGIEHGDLPSSIPGRKIIKNLLKEPAITNISDPAILPGPPSTYSTPSGIQVAVGCPVELHIYDSENRHTGPTSDSTWEANIPQSIYFAVELADTNSKKIILLPEGDLFRIKIIAQNTISKFDLDIDQFDSTGTIQSTAIFENIPIQENSLVYCELSNVSDSLELEMDRDGDGNIDTVYNPVIVTLIENNQTKHTIVENYALDQNYPNPFNPTTKISYALPSNAFVELKIFNVIGQEIITLVNEEKPAGVYEVNFDAHNLPSGVYLYKLRADEFVQTKKMILLK